MTFELFINFNGNCREAIEFYSKCFNSEIKNLMTFGEAPSDPNMPTDPAEKDLIMYAEIKIGDKNIMFMDASAKWPVTVGNSITPTLNITDHAEIDRLTKELGEGGTVHMPPAKAFFSPYYAMVEDRFGTIWQLLDPAMPEA